MARRPPRYMHTRTVHNSVRLPASILFISRLAAVKWVAQQRGRAVAVRMLEVLLAVAVHCRNIHVCQVPEPNPNVRHRRYNSLHATQTNITIPEDTSNESFPTRCSISNILSWLEQSSGTIGRPDEGTENGIVVLHRKNTMASVMDTDLLLDTTLHMHRSTWVEQYWHAE